MVNKTIVIMLRTLIDKNTKSWEDFLPFIEFAYNNVVHNVGKCLPFEIVYSFNPLSLIDLFHLPSNEVINFQADEKTAILRELHKRS